jgi:hypothetical protein
VKVLLLTGTVVYSDRAKLSLLYYCTILNCYVYTSNWANRARRTGADAMSLGALATVDRWLPVDVRTIIEGPAISAPFTPEEWPQFLGAMEFNVETPDGYELGGEYEGFQPVRPR